MEKFIEKWLYSPGKVVLLVLAFNLVFLVLGRTYSLDRNTWPSWIQGIGSIQALLLAIWVAAKQKRDAENADREKEIIEINRIQKASGEELAAFSNMFHFPALQTLQSRSEEMIFEIPIPLYEYRFQVYDALVDKIILIPDVRLRTDIMGIYQSAGHLLMCSRENNRLLRELREIEDIPEYSNIPKLHREYEIIRDGMRELCKQMRAIAPGLHPMARHIAEKLGAAL